MITHWAQIDADGEIVNWGTAFGTDVYLQPLAAGLRLVGRPENVNGYGNWKFVENEWVEIPEHQNL